MPGPFSRTKAWTIWSSDMPTASMRAIFSLAGLEKLHSSMLHVDTESLQPHWHCKCAPTRRTSWLGISEAVCAIAARATRITSRLAFNRCMFLRDAHHFGAGVLHLYFARHQAREGAADQHQSADPDPAHQGEDIRLDYRALVVVGHAAEIQIQIFVGPLANADFRRPLAAGCVEPLLGLQSADHFTALGNLHVGAVPLVDGVFALFQVDHAQRVGADPHRVA